MGYIGSNFVEGFLNLASITEINNPVVLADKFPSFMSFGEVHNIIFWKTVDKGKDLSHGGQL